MEYNMFLLKYGEIGIKGKNKYKFEDVLCKSLLLRQLDLLLNLRLINAMVAYIQKH